MRFANRISRLAVSPIREILHVIDQPGMISFAGGLPSADSFPEISVAALDHQQLQYGASEGDANLRQFIASDLAERGLQVTAEQVLVLSGSQQGIDLVAKLLIDCGSRVAVESPTYLAALQVFSLFGADYLPYTPQSISTLGDQRDVSMTYVVPTFQNPTGHCYSAEQRKSLAAGCDANQSVLFEDDPYRDLSYDDCERRPVCSFVKNASWIYQSSFSKTLAPGLRLGYLVCSSDLFERLCWLKQASDLHSNRLSQHLVLSQLTNPHAPTRLLNVVADYRARRDFFAQELDKHFGGLASWQVPAGGLFFWSKIHSDQAFDSGEVLKEALAHQVAFMPGEPFFPVHAENPGFIRLNFSHASAAQVVSGLETLANLIASRLASR